MSLFYPEHREPGQVPIIEDAMNVTQFYVFASACAFGLRYAGLAGWALVFWSVFSAAAWGIWAHATYFGGPPDKDPKIAEYDRKRAKVLAIYQAAVCAIGFLILR